jgi:hypothetical protein
MRPRALFALTVEALFLAGATPAAAKPTFDEARISGPDLGEVACTSPVRP